MTNTPRGISDILTELQDKLSADIKTIGDVLDVFHERGFGLLIILFAFPMALPLPVPPGVNLLFALPLLFLTAQQIIGARAPWFPNFIRRKSVSKKMLNKIAQSAKPWFKRLEYFIKPRMAFITHGAWSNVIGLFGFIFTLCVCIPIPMTNTVPSFAIFIMAIGVLMRDGLAILAGIVIGSGWITLLATIGVAGFKAIINYIIG